jgi:hypothetical protein
MAGTSRPIDEKLWTYTARRPVGEWVFAVRACPLQAHWLDGEPLTDVLAMGGIVDRYRRFVVDGSPVATGFVAVADAWSCTNPSAGRGLTIGFMHAVRLRDAMREAGDNPRRLVETFHDKTESEITPWYEAQIATDRVRFAQMEAIREQCEPKEIPEGLAKRIIDLMTTMAGDPDLFRAALEYIGTVTPVQKVLKRPDVMERIDAVKGTMKNAPPTPVPGPDRKQLLEILE